MKNFAVLLDLVTEPGAGITFLGQAASLFTRLPPRKGASEVVWRLESGLADSESLERQVSALQKKVPFHKLADKTDIRPYLNVGVFYDTLTCSVQLPPNVIRAVNEANITVEVTCYPSAKEKRKKGRC